MNIKEKIKLSAEKLGIDCCGVTNYCCNSFIVCLFPYYISFEKGNISRYAAVKDYHKICKQYLVQIAENADITDYDVFADISPYNERELAKNAGLGVIGKNGLLINKKYGSYVFIGLIRLNKTLLEEDMPCTEQCLECGKCVKGCPTGALADDTFLKEKCLSHITQKKGTLSGWEEEMIKTGGMVWGCDRCSENCPMNKNVQETPIKEFKEDILKSVFLKDICDLSNKEFLEKYSEKAFTWRGKSVLKRNCKIIEEI